MSDLNVLVLVKGDEKYTWMYSDGEETAVLNSLGRYAGHPELSFSWYDAAKLATWIRKRMNSVASEWQRESKRLLLKSKWNRESRDG